MDLSVYIADPYEIPIYWTLLKIPEGYTYNSPNITTNDDYYNPNQNVLDCGISTATIYTQGAPQRIRINTKKFITLESGDAIILLISTVTNSET